MGLKNFITNILYGIRDIFYEDRIPKIQREKGLAQFVTDLYSGMPFDVKNFKLTRNGSRTILKYNPRKEIKSIEPKSIYEYIPAYKPFRKLYERMEATASGLIDKIEGGLDYSYGF